MKKILLFMMLLLVGGILMGDTNEVHTTLSFSMNAATNYLEVRPNSNKSYNPLTHTQLLALLDAVTVEVNQAVDGLYDVDQELIINRLNTYTGLLDGVTQTTFENDEEFYYGIYEGLFELYALTLESKPVEGRGMWHRPFETNLDQVRTTLAELQDMGINMLYVETFWMGRLIYPSNLPNTFQHYFTSSGYRDDTVDYGTNLLEAFVEEGKQYGIEVHAWVENFFVGYGTKASDSPILNQFPEWALYNYDYTIPQKQEVNYIFMDPANPEVRDYVKAIYGEIASRFDIASIHLDYIRYPVIANPTNVGTSNRDNGYSEYAEREFKTIYGYTGDLRTLVVTDSQAAADWKAYKTQVISDFVAGVYYTVKNQNPDVYLSTAIFGNLSHALDTKMQDWASWIDDGLIELILPMAYYQSSITVRSEVGNLTTIVDKNAFSYAGIAPSYMGYNDHLNTTQIEASIDGHAMGATFFASQHYLVRNVDGINSFNTKVQTILQQGVFRNQAIIPHGDTAEVIDAWLDVMLSKADRIYTVEAVMTPTQRTDYQTRLDQYRTYPVDTPIEIQALIDALEQLVPSMYASSPASIRIQEDIQYLIDILEIKSNRHQFQQSIDITINPDPNTYFEELVELSPPTNLRVEDDRIVWDLVSGVSNYVLNVNDVLYDVDIELDTQGSFYLPDAVLRNGTNVIGVYAKGDGIVSTDSTYGNIVQFQVTKLAAPTNLHIIDNVLYFDPVEDAIEYVVHIGLDDITIEDATFDLSPYTSTNTEYYIQVQAIGNDYSTLNSNDSTRVSFGTGTESLSYRMQDLFTGFIQHNINHEQEEE